jgi:hypothetical protein
MAKNDSFWVWILIILAVIWLPTLTPEDIPTTFFLIKIFGIKLWLIIGGIIIFLLVSNGKKL